MDSLSGVVPSILHQKMKFIIENKLVLISREDLLVTKLTATSYIDAAEEALESAF